MLQTAMWTSSRLSATSTGIVHRLPPAKPSDGHESAAMREVLKYGGGQDTVDEDLPPLGDPKVRREADQAFHVALCDDLDQ